MFEVEAKGLEKMREYFVVPKVIASASLVEMQGHFLLMEYIGTGSIMFS